MAREVVIDTETTGLSASKGDRIIELAAVELVDHLPTGKFFHSYINPNRNIPIESTRIHNLTDKFVANKPPFLEIAKDFLFFIGNSALIIHNAPFDISFLQNEIKLSGLEAFNPVVVDTLLLAKEKYPGSSVSLDSLCKRFNIDISSRKQRGHGALIDSILLSEVYLELQGGKQPGLGLDTNFIIKEAKENTSTYNISRNNRPKPLPPRLSKIEMENHKKFIKNIGCEKGWKRVNLD
jgi:DNA polymerase-3 subunit epsilon